MEERGWRLEAEDEMAKFKIQMRNNGIRNTENGGRKAGDGGRRTDTQYETLTELVRRQGWHD
jgi:hypothetical protein